MLTRMDRILFNESVYRDKFNKSTIRIDEEVEEVTPKVEGIDYEIDVGSIDYNEDPIFLRTLKSLKPVEDSKSKNLLSMLSTLKRGV